MKQTLKRELFYFCAVLALAGCLALSGCKDEPAIWLESIVVISPPHKTGYVIGTELDLAGLVVRGYYSNGSEKAVIVTEANISNYDKNKAGIQYVVITVSGKTSTFMVEIAPTGQLALTLGLVNNEDNSIVIYGLPDGDIKLSTGTQNGLPNSMLISTGGAHPSAIYDSITWFIDGVQCFDGDNIITIYATHYTFIMPHTITIIVVKDGVAYSRTLIFTVEA
jgi:hypothetical protein